MFNQYLYDRLISVDPELKNDFENPYYFRSFRYSSVAYCCANINSLSDNEELFLVDFFEQRAIAKGKEFNQKWAINYCFWEEGQKQCHQYIIYKNVELNFDDDVEDEDEDDGIEVNIGVGNITDNKLESLFDTYCTALERIKNNDLSKIS